LPNVKGFDEDITMYLFERSILKSIIFEIHFKEMSL